MQGAQWTGIVTQIAMDMLESNAVDAVVCVQNEEGDRFAPKPVSYVMLFCAIKLLILRQEAGKYQQTT